MRTLDKIDFEILRLLQNNARLSNKELAAQIGLAPSSCLERTRRLQEEKILLGFHAVVDKQSMDIGLEAMIAVKLKTHTLAEVEGFRNHILSLPMVMASYHVTGNIDFLLQVVVKDVNHLREVVLSAFTTRPEVAHIETSIIFEHKENHTLPNYNSMF